MIDHDGKTLVKKRTKFYTYKGITGTLLEICDIFNADLDEVKMILKHSDIEDAIESTKHNRKWHWNYYILFSEYDRIDDFSKLSDEQKEYAEKHINVVNNFIKTRKITDDDVIQNIYIMYLYLIVKFDNPNYQYDTNKILHISIGLSRYYIRIMKTQYLKSILFVDIETGLGDQYYMIERTICDREIIKAMMDTISNKKLINDRNRKMVFLRFGIEGEAYSLEKIGNKYNITRGRVNQIILRVFSKLRNPIHNKPYRGKW